MHSSILASNLNCDKDTDQQCPPVSVGVPTPAPLPVESDLGSYPFPGESLTHCPWFQFNGAHQLNNCINYMDLLPHSTQDLAHWTCGFEDGQIMQTGYGMEFNPDEMTHTLTPHLSQSRIGVNPPLIDHPDLLESHSRYFSQRIYTPHKPPLSSKDTPWSFTECLFADLLSASHNVDIDPEDDGYFCGWILPDGLTRCCSHLRGNSTKHAISRHLASAHDLASSKGKSTQQCRWAGCGKELKQESLVRHVLTVHLRFEAVCKACGSSFARQDSLRRHIKNTCGAAKRAE